MPPRIEPTLQPTGTARLRGDGLHASPRQQQPLPAAAGRWLMGWISGLVLLALLLPLLAIVALRWLPPPTTSYMLQSPVKPVKYQWVPESAIAEVARRAVVVSEDQKFWSHDGFDMEAIEQAEQYNRNPRHHRRGASTISQQTAKNLFLWPGGYVRKGIEAVITVLLEKLWGKHRILEMYLNIAEFGPGIYGVEAASQTYFGKPAARLSAEEAARIVAVLPNPRHWSVRTPGPYGQARTVWILGQMGYGAKREEPEAPPGELPGDPPNGGDAEALSAPASAARAPASPAQPAAPAAADAPADAAPADASPQQAPGSESAPPAKDPPR